MRPLREEVGSADAETAREARLLRAMSPLQPSLARMQRVRTALEARPARWWHVLGAHPVLAAAGGAGLALLLMAQIQLRSTVAAVADADSIEAQRAARRRSEAARTDFAGTAAQLTPAPVAGGVPTDATPVPTELPSLTPTAPLVAGSAGTGSAPSVVSPSLHPGQTQTVDAHGVTPQVAQQPQGPPLQQLPGTLPIIEILPPAGMLAVTPLEPAPREPSLGTGMDPAVTGGTAPTVVAGGGYGSPLVPVSPTTVAPDPGRGGGNSGGSGQVTPPRPGGEHATPGGGRRPGNWEAAVVATREPAPDSDGRTIELAFNGSLDGRPVSGTVLWRRGDDGIHALVLHRDDSDVVKSTAVQTPAEEVSETGIDFDDDGQEDILVSLDPQSGEKSAPKPSAPSPPSPS